MRKNFILAAFTFSVSLSLFAAPPTNYMTYMGGGGEPLSARSTQFDLGATFFSNYAIDENRNYNITVNFNGGHQDTEKMLKEKFTGSKIVENFNKESFDKIVNDYIGLLTNDKIPANGKILLFINSHGGEAKGNTHEISAAKSVMSNLNTGNKDGMISLDVLAKLSELAEKKNVKLAIIDASCHSGTSIKLANSKTCVISSSGPNHYGFSNFAEVFASQMLRGRNLEEIFLNTREIVGADGFPEISTPEGLEVHDELYALITPYLYFHDMYRGSELDKIDTYIKGQAKAYRENSCTREDNFKKLNAVLKLIEDVTTVERGVWFFKSQEKGVDLTSLKESIAKYKVVQEDYIKKLSDLESPDLKKIEPLVLDNGNTSPGYSHEELVGTDWDYFINEKTKDLQADLPDSKKAILEISRAIYIKAKEKKEEILKKYPSYLETQKLILALKTDTAVGFDTASNIAKEAQKAYAAYYKVKKEKRAEEKKPKKNACNDFVL